MIKGEKPYDAKAAETAASTIAKNWLAFVKLFPDDSKSGGETTAAPKIWETRKDFEDKGSTWPRLPKPLPRMHPRAPMSSRRRSAR